MPQGLDLAAFRDWIDKECPGLVAGELSAELITGGKSNVTYAVSDGSCDLVVRRPPLGHVLATAHDMGREHRIMTALAGTDVPVPTTYALCTDPDIIGAPFYVMDKVAGTPYGKASELTSLGADRTREISKRLVDTLVTLHTVDYPAVGLTDFGRPDGYLTRQLSRWQKQLASSKSRELPGMDDLIAHLERSVPATSEATIVHGDYRLDNLLVDDQDQVSAVLDWEMSTIGDPLTDVAVLLAYQQLAESLSASGPGAALVTDAPLAAGYLSRAETLERYAAATGRDVDHIGFHLGLAFFKLAVILEGIHFRHTHGQTLGSGFDGIGDAIEPLIAAGLDATR